MTNPTPTGVQDIWFKAQRVLRTIVQTGIPAFVGLVGVLPTIISALGLPVTGSLYIWLTAVAAGATAVAGALTRVMAIPAVNAWLTTIGLGSVPKSEAQAPSVLVPGDGLGATPSSQTTGPDHRADGSTE